MIHMSVTHSQNVWMVHPIVDVFHPWSLPQSSAAARDEEPQVQDSGGYTSPHDILKKEI